jgi:hypothetical protein
MLKSSSLCLYSSNFGTFSLKKNSSPLKLQSQFQPNFAEMILRWSPFKIVSISTVLYPRWPPLLKIEISSNGQNCFILSQKVPKFELHKHHLGYRTVLMDTILKGDHLRIISAKFGWNWLSSFREDFFLISSPLFSNILRDFLWTLKFCRFWPIMQILKKGRWN